MSQNIKNDVSMEDLTSDEDLSNMISTERGVIPTFHHSNHPETTETRCSICLQEWNNKSHPNTCFHMFCFECLKQWSDINSTCPLCKNNFQQIHHSLNESIHETYEVPGQEIEPLETRIVSRYLNVLADNNRSVEMMNDTHTEENLSREVLVLEELTDLSQLTFDLIQNHHIIFVVRRSSSAVTTIMRILVYRDNMWADPLPSIINPLTDFSSTFFRENPAQVSRLRSFIMRDITAIRSIESLRTDVNIHEIHLMNIILNIISNLEIRNAHATNILRSYLGEYAAHFYHELLNFAASPYNLLDYDHNVRYTRQQSHSPSNQNGINILRGIRLLDDSTPDPDITTIQTSSSDDSNVDILSPPSPPIEEHDSSGDQSYRSTGIRRNNRYNLRNRR